VNDVISTDQIIAKIKLIKVKQLENGYVRFVVLSFFFSCAKFCPF